MTAGPGSYFLRLRGILRSLRMYYGGRDARGRMDSFYGALVDRGDLCFDIGAHAGNRTLTFLRLGARVVALEPQPDFQRLLRFLLLFRSAGEKSRVTLLAEAVGRESGTLELHVSEATPTVTSGSRRFMDDTGAIPSFDIVDWNRRIEVPQTTIDRLIERHGMPAFIKLDIEGMELDALFGLSRLPGLLSFEFLAGRTDDALACLARIEDLGPVECQISRGEDLSFEWDGWRPADQVRSWLEDHRGEDFSGDIYARRLSPD
ncbi:MAG: FkbM family methyltransferase [Geminicoccaceae bacterium]